MASLQLKNICKVYSNGFEAVKDFNLKVEDKEFIIFVGPSGCGKSTTLRMIAGLEEISSGELTIDGKIMNDVEPKDRDIAMVFQNYALYPHMTVYDNMAFGLKLRKTPKEEIKRKVEEAARILDLEQLLDRKPKALSGGQRQRVAMGRAIVRNPKVFLMDEPLSNLDAKLRVQMRTEIAALHNRLGATIIYVTHDQTEAMTLGTRIVVLKDGVIMQVDSPQKLYNQPDNLFVAGFIGSPQMNFIDATVTVDGSKAKLDFDKFSVELPPEKALDDISLVIPDGQFIGVIGHTGSGKSTLMQHLNGLIRATDGHIYFNGEDIYDKEEELEKYSGCVVESDVTGYELLGAEVLLYFTINGANMCAKVNSDTPARYGDHIKVAFDVNKIHVFDKESELTITN